MPHTLPQMGQRHPSFEWCRPFLGRLRSPAQPSRRSRKSKRRSAFTTSGVGEGDGTRTRNHWIDSPIWAGCADYSSGPSPDALPFCYTPGLYTSVHLIQSTALHVTHAGGSWPDSMPFRAEYLLPSRPTGNLDPSRGPWFTAASIGPGRSLDPVDLCPVRHRPPCLPIRMASGCSGGGGRGAASRACRGLRSRRSPNSHSR